MIRGRHGVGAAIAIVVMCGLAPTAQTPARDPSRKDPVDAASATPTGTGSISGFVTTLDASPAAIRLASVVLVGTNTGVMRLTMTDRAGRFSFHQLPVDRYAIAAGKPPYLGMMAGARRHGQPGSPIALAIVAQDAYIDPEQLERWSRTATRLSLREGETKKVEIKR